MRNFFIVICLLVLSALTYSQQVDGWIDGTTTRQISKAYPMPAQTNVGTLIISLEDTVSVGRIDSLVLNTAKYWTKPTITCDSGTIQISYNRNFTGFCMTLKSGESWTLPAVLSTDVSNTWYIRAKSNSISPTKHRSSVTAK